MPVQLRRHVSFTATEYGGVLLDETKGAYWRLNTTGAEVVRTMGEVERDEIVRHVVATFDVDAQTAAQDVDTLLAELRDAGLVAS